MKGLSAGAAAPFISFLAALCLWQAAVKLTHVPPYLVPGPIAIVQAFWADAPGLLRALVATLSVTFAALLAAVILGVALACGMAASRWAKAAIEPWAVILQVTPVVAIAPLIIVWIGDPFTAMVVCATVVAFFEAAMVEDVLVLPYAKQGLIGEVYESARVLSEEYDETGRVLTVRGLPGAITRLRRSLAAP